MQRDGALDAVVVDLETLDAMEVPGTVLDLDEMVPAVGQGALALVCRMSDARTLEALESVHHHDTALCVGVERAFLMGWEGESKGAVGCYAWREGHHLVAEGCVGGGEGVQRLRLRSDLLHGFALGRALARQLQSAG
jgi:hydroxymethylbilane synthase